MKISSVADGQLHCTDFTVKAMYKGVLRAEYSIRASLTVILPKVRNRKEAEISLEYRQNTHIFAS